MKWRSFGWFVFLWIICVFIIYLSGPSQSFCESMQYSSFRGVFFSGASQLPTCPYPTAKDAIRREGGLVSNIQFLVFARREKLESKVQELRQSWVGKVDATVYVCAEAGEDANSEVPGAVLVESPLGELVTEGSALWLYSLKHAFEQSSQEKEWFFICEDDTWVNTDVLWKALSRFDANKHVYLGHPETFDILGELTTSYAIGGAGLILSRQLVSDLLSAGNGQAFLDCVLYDFGDLSLGRCIQDVLHIRPQRLLGLHVHAPEHYFCGEKVAGAFDFPGCPPISFHDIRSGRMVYLDYVYK